MGGGGGLVTKDVPRHGVCFVYGGGGCCGQFYSFYLSSFAHVSYTSKNTCPEFTAIFRGKRKIMQ